MKAIILAAGQGTRIRSAHGEHPKCLVTFNKSDRTILDQQIHNLFVAGVSDIGIVIGYEKDQIIRHVTKNYSGALNRFKFIENPRFAETNNIYSLWLAREWLKRNSFVVLNADVVFDPRILPAALASTTPITMIVDRACRDETMKVIMRGNRITRMSKDITEDEFSGTCIGVTVFDRSIAHPFLNRIDHLIREGRQQVFFNVGVQQLIDKGVRVGYTETRGLTWAEIDDAADLAFARLYVFPNLLRSGVAA